ncbi:MULTISPECIES: VOC family protein [unclassified Actinopolyspora]|uniref:VOC family protein n=1 Tax=unclassified Actinopolyspora TaxID=2639451 RepID=UPI0013F5CFBF|nr:MULTISPECIES: VOC family protein [unclassified Actinopolyspora]NHD15783.1 VOC family protein [Actinopolyspora sp. BKK2]NHE75003.1 VOC family protein [Actinopolyspora sp. BKK1]
MITTDFVVGSPCWIDIAAADVSAAVEFYRSVFDWEYEQLDDQGEYGYFRLGGRKVAGIGSLTEEDARSAWMIYFRTDDVDETSQTVRQLGGTVRREPFEDDQARMAQFSDPLGAQFAVWQPKGFQGVEKTDEPGALNWIELYTTHVAAAKEFYVNLFGWQMEDMPLPSGSSTYSLITPSGGSQERMIGGMMQLAPEHLTLTSGLPYWHPVFAVQDCDATMSRVVSSGGSVQMGPENAAGVGRMAVCLDLTRSDFVVLESAAE